jgi:hypothetical protein
VRGEIANCKMKIANWKTGRKREPRNTRKEAEGRRDHESFESARIGEDGIIASAMED